MGLIDRAQESASNQDWILHDLNRTTREILAAYRNTWDVLSELIQNSVDAINRRCRDSVEAAGNEEPSFTEGRIHLEINAAARRITIYDDGNGISQENLETYTLPDQSGKVMGQDLGFKGKGLTACAFSSVEYSIISRANNGTEPWHVLSLNGLVNWVVENYGSDIGDYEPLPDNDSIAYAEDIEGDWSTIISVKLHEDYQSLRHLGGLSTWDLLWNHFATEEDLEAVEMILRTRTALGNTNALFGQDPEFPINATISVIFQDETRINNHPIEYTFLHPSEQYDQHFGGVVRQWETQLELEQDHLTASEDKTFHILSRASGYNEYIIGQREESQFSVSTHISVIGQGRLTRIQHQLGFDGRDSDVEMQSGIYLSINGMPTQIELSQHAKDKWRGGVYNRYFVVVNADLNISRELDAGRKGISKYFAEKMVDQILDILNGRIEELSGAPRLKSYLQVHWDRSTEAVILNDDTSHEIMVTQSIEKGQPFSNEDQFHAYCMYFLGQCCAPQYEQEVITIFQGLVARQLLPGYRSIYNSPSSLYDAGYTFDLRRIPFQTSEPDGDDLVVKIFTTTGYERWLFHSRDDIEEGHPFGVASRYQPAFSNEDIPIAFLDITNGFPPAAALVERNRRTKIGDRGVLCVEFKRNLSHTISRQHGFGVGNDQQIRDVDIIVFWNDDLGEDLPEGWRYTRVASSNIVFPGVNRLLVHSETGDRALVIQLDEIISSLSKLQRWKEHHGIM